MSLQINVPVTVGSKWIAMDSKEMLAREKRVTVCDAAS